MLAKDIQLDAILIGHYLLPRLDFNNMHLVSRESNSTLVKNVLDTWDVRKGDTIRTWNMIRLVLLGLMFKKPVENIEKGEFSLLKKHPSKRPTSI